MKIQAADATRTWAVTAYLRNLPMMKKAVAKRALLLMVASAATLLHAEEQNLLDEAGDAFVKGDFTMAVQRFKESAEKGNAEAQDTLGLMYYYGLGVAKNSREAIKWDTMATQKGKLDARFRLSLEKDGDGPALWHLGTEIIGEADNIEKRGNPLDEFTVGLCYRYSRYYPPDFTHAFTWAMKAAQAGLPPAQFFVGDCYENGNGVEANKKEAKSWYEKAAQGGLQDANSKVGFLLQKQGDAEGAKFWLTRAAVIGSQRASYTLKRDYGILVGDCSEWERYENASESERSKMIAEEAFSSKAFKPSAAQQNFIVKAAAVAIFGIVAGTIKEYSSLTPEQQEERSREGEAMEQRLREERERAQSNERMDELVREMVNEGE